jgi:homoserine O-succinyltransferase
LQGHPEYEAHTLLREYRRDVRRYLSGFQGSYPHVPTGYLGPLGIAALEEFEIHATAQEREPALMRGFPFEFVAGHVQAPWLAASRALMANWLQAASERAQGVEAPVEERSPTGLQGALQ